MLDQQPGAGDVALLHVTSVVHHGLSLGLRGAGFEPARPDDVLGWATEAPGRVVVLPDTSSGLDLLTGLHRSGRDVRSVALLLQRDVPSYRRALAVCTGAVPLDAELAAIIATVAAARQGNALLPAEVARELLCATAVPGTPPGLSRQETAWLRRLADGDTVTALARGAGYSEREMYRRLSSMYAQLGAGTRTEALLRAERFGLLQGGGEPRDEPHGGRRAPGRTSGSRAAGRGAGDG